MSNPKNLCSFGGIIDDVSTTYNREGNIHYVEFTLKIARNFLNKGEQRFDYPRCRYSKSDVKSLLSDITEGREVSVVCSYMSEPYNYNGKSYTKTFFSVESFTFSSEGENEIDNNISFELPF